MKFRQPLDAVLDHPGKVRLLRFLCRKGGEWNGRRLAAEVSLNPVTAHKLLRQLREATVLDFRKVGTNFVYSLRDRHALVEGCLRPLFEQEARMRDALRRLLQCELNGVPRSPVVSVALYGSLVKGQERPTSDMDLLVLVKSEAAKPSVRAALDRAGAAVLRAFGNPLAPYLNTIHEARHKARQGLPLFRDILASHRLLFGAPLEEALHDRAA